jgi:hypothetical protein
MSDEVIEKVIRTTEVSSGGGGLLSPEQSNRFLDYVFDTTVLGKVVRVKRLKADTAEIDKVSVGTHLLRAATEAVDTGQNAGATFTKISITTTKVRLDWEISTESLEDNIEGDSLEDHIARLMAGATANDLEDLSINGDDDSADAFIGIMDGWRKRLLLGAHVVDAAGANISRATFNKALKAMPRKYMQRRDGLRFFTGTQVIQDYLFSLQNTSQDFVTPLNTAERMINETVKPDGPAGFATGFAFGKQLIEVPAFDEGRDGDYSGPSGDHADVWLTWPDNLIWAVKRDITVYRQFVQKKDTTEYTMYARVGTQVEELDAVVVTKNVKIVP